MVVKYFIFGIFKCTRGFLNFILFGRKYQKFKSHKPAYIGDKGQGRRAIRPDFLLNFLLSL